MIRTGCPIQEARAKIYVYDGEEEHSEAQRRTAQNRRQGRRKEGTVNASVSRGRWRSTVTAAAEGLMESWSNETLRSAGGSCTPRQKTRLACGAASSFVGFICKSSPFLLFIEMTFFGNGRVLFCEIKIIKTQKSSLENIIISIYRCRYLWVPDQLPLLNRNCLSCNL